MVVSALDCNVEYFCQYSVLQSVGTIDDDYADTADCQINNQRVLGFSHSLSSEESLKTASGRTQQDRNTQVAGQRYTA